MRPLNDSILSYSKANSSGAQSGKKVSYKRISHCSQRKYVLFAIFPSSLTFPSADCRQIKWQWRDLNIIESEEIEEFSQNDESKYRLLSRITYCYPEEPYQTLGTIKTNQWILKQKKNLRFQKKNVKSSVFLEFLKLSTNYFNWSILIEIPYMLKSRNFNSN